MRRFILLGLTALAACSSPEERTRCTTTADCKAGEVCAHTSEGAVCWPDDVAPVVSAVTLTCLDPTASGACPRDGRVRVTAKVTDDREVGVVKAALSLWPSLDVPLTAAGTGYAGEVALAELPFAAFEGDLTATVTAADGAGNAVAREATAAIPVTRLRWTYDAGRPLTPAAIDDQGTIYVGRADATGQAVAIGADGIEKWRVSLGSADVVAAPMVGASLWFASTGGTLYRITPAETGATVSGQCATGGTITAPPALSRSFSMFAIVGNESGSLYVANDANLCNQTAAGGPVKSQTVFGAEHAFVTAGSSLRSFDVLSGGALSDRWSSALNIGSGSAAPAIDAVGNVWTVSNLGAVKRTSAAASSDAIASVGAEVDGVVVLSDGTAVLGDDSGKLKRLGAGAPWTETEALSGTPCAPLALDGVERILLTGTSTGGLYAIREADATVSWSHSFGTAALRIANVFHQPGDALPTAYVPAADGKLHAIVVDGDLDASSPWPKPYHDPQNTGNAASPLR